MSNNAKQQAVILQPLESIAETETSLAYLIETEADKLRTAINRIERDETGTSIDPLLHINHSVKKMLETIIKKEMLLEFELDALLELLTPIEPSDCHQTIGFIRNPEDTNQIWFIIEWLGTENTTWTYLVTNVQAPLWIKSL